MPECQIVHPIYKGRGKGRKVIDYKPHVYIAGHCMQDPLNHPGFAAFLRATYPMYESNNYEDSKRLKVWSEE